MSLDNKKDTPNLWMHHMLRGAFEEAWKFSDEVMKSRAGKPCWHLPRHLQYFWDGTPLNGKRILIRCYHGLGDTLQYIRYAPLVKSIAREVIVWVQPSLIPLLRNTTGIDQLLPLHDGTPYATFDVDIEVMELAYIFRTTLATIPSTVPYVHVDAMPLVLKSANIKVGLVWKAGPFDEHRNIPFEQLKSLFNIVGIDVYILQASANAAGWEDGYGINPGDFDLYNYARFMMSLDLIITVDSMPVHLAGAMGKPVWNLLHSAADWRWMKDRDDTPWYPTMRLFRQRSPGDWSYVIDQVTIELQKLVTKKLSHFLLR